MKFNEEYRKHLTAEEWQWTESNVAHYKVVPIAGEDYIMLILKSGNIVLGQTLREAVRMEMNQTGEILQLDGFETDEINSLLRDE